MELHLTATKCHLSYGDHTVLPATWHKWTHPALNPARQAGTRFTHPGGMEGWVDLGDLLHTKMVGLYSPADGHPSIASTNQALTRLTTLINANALTTTLRRAIVIDLGYHIVGATLATADGHNCSVFIIWYETDHASYTGLRPVALPGFGARRDTKLR